MSLLTFQTVKKDSYITRLDFRTKLFIMFVLSAIALLWESLVLEGLLALAIVFACLAVGVKFSYIRNLIVLMMPFSILLLVTQGFFADDLLYARIGQTDLTPLFLLPEDWWLTGGAMMSLEGLEYASSIILKTLALTLVIPLGIFTSDINTMIVGMVKAHIPYKIAYIFSSTLRFFPLLFDEIQSIIEAQKLRGLEFDKMGPVKRISVYARIAVPLILGALVKTQKLEVVLQSKAFTGSPDRTYLHESELRAQDYVFLSFFALLFITAVISYILWGVGRFRGPI